MFFGDDHRKRIVLIEDHALVRQGLERLLNFGDEFVVCEEAGNAADGIEVVREIRPDAVIVDVGLPDGPDGIELTETLRAEFPGLIVLILSAHDDPEYVRRAARAGAMGYILKSEDVENLRAALRNAFNGKLTFSDEIISEIGD
jgi:DNA-binding NarL/FixJ family response regulator